MREKTGTVVSTKMNKTIVIEVFTYKNHPKYNKRYLVSRKFKAHCPDDRYQEGDTATIYETKPISKTKSWTTEKPNLPK